MSFKLLHILALIVLIGVTETNAQESSKTDSTQQCRLLPDYVKAAIEEVNK